MPMKTGAAFDVTGKNSNSFEAILIHGKAEEAALPTVLHTTL